MKNRKNLIWILVLVMIAVTQFAAAANTDNLTIIISSPEEGDIFFHDVSPAYLTVEGFIHSSNTIRNITATYGTEAKECGKDLGYPYINISCSFLFNDNIDKIILTATDDQGTVISETRNFTSHGGIPPPGFIVVSGNVTDITGKPISGAIISFENTEKKYSMVNITTDLTGKYSIKGDYGRHQKITVIKEGYTTINQEITFEPYGHDIDFTLSPQQSSKSSSVILSSTFVIIVVCIVLLFTVKKK